MSVLLTMNTIAFSPHRSLIAFALFWVLARGQDDEYGNSFIRGGPYANRALDVFEGGKSSLQ